ncbi:Por secretion system C-terminal sorting domain-containing protein [Halpernia humi]|uniref:Por secretion system C-terminal sorting domain-containing protein n=1 Tax=Halpernia humi TaxID=493375 RepID=A0A1H5WNI1_9FLAO|nr:ELWxxDGT repeat protein [Halpernia humi]SEG01169.1 Por secretion system C-terminal sorting domain-containing protein [Halpernia humi]
MKKISILISTVSSLFIFSQVTLVKDINPGTSNSNPGLTIEYNGSLYFKASDGTNGTELWKSDGTTSGTVMVSDYRSGSASFNPQQFVVFDNKLFFQGNDGTNGAEVYTYDGTTISLFADLKTGSGSSVPQNFEVIGSNLYFKAQEATSTNNKIYKTDGTAAPTVIDPTYNIAFGIEKLGTDLILSASPSNSYQLYKCDGTTYTLIKTINPSGSASPTNFYSDGNKVYFSADDGTNGKELWATDGTSAGTAMIKDISSSPGADSSPNHFFSFNGKIYFSANDGTNGTELWVTDGTDAGTSMLKDINVGSGNSNPSDFFAYNGKLYFTANDTTNGNELWETDGTNAGTKLFLDINPGSASSSPTDLILFNGEVFLNTNDGTVGKEFYKIDSSVLGTADGIAKQTSFYPNPSNGKLFSNAKKGFIYQVYDVKGALLKSGKSTAGNLNLNLPDGIYILKYTIGEKSAATKIVIKNK